VILFFMVALVVCVGVEAGGIVSPVILTFVSNLWRAESRIWWRRR